MPGGGGRERGTRACVCPCLSMYVIVRMSVRVRLQHSSPRVDVGIRTQPPQHSSAAPARIASPPACADLPEQASAPLPAPATRPALGECPGSASPRQEGRGSLGHEFRRVILPSQAPWTLPRPGPSARALGLDLGQPLPRRPHESPINSNLR